MKIYEYVYEKLGTVYTDEKMFIFAESQEEADKKMDSYLDELIHLGKEEGTYFGYQIKKSTGEINALFIGGVGNSVKGVFIGAKTDGKNQKTKDMDVFEVVSNTEQQVVLKNLVKTPLEVALHPYLDSSYSYITVTKGKNHIFTVVKADGTKIDFSFGAYGHTCISNEMLELKKHVLEFISDKGILINTNTLKSPEKAIIFYDSATKKWQAKLYVNGEEENYCSKSACCKEDLIKEVQEKFNSKLNVLTYKKSEMGIDTWVLTQK